MTNRTGRPIVDPEKSIHNQLSLFGVDGLKQALRDHSGTKKRKLISSLGGSADERALLLELEKVDKDLDRELDRVDAAYKSTAFVEDVSFLHAGLCQTGLPHSRPKSNDEVYQRSNGKFHLLVEPGSIVDPDTGKAYRVGVPYGAKARLIFVYINTRGVTNRSVSLGSSMSAWMKNLGLQVTGGADGSIRLVKEQTVRLGRARFSFQFEHHDAEGGSTLDISDTQIADELCLWVNDNDRWVEEIELTPKFHDHLRQHAVPLCDHAIHHLSGSSLKLDLYAWAAWRLPQLKKPQPLNWVALANTFPVVGPTHKVAGKIKDALIDVHDVYKDMKIDVTRNGLILHPSAPPIPKRRVVVPGNYEADVKQVPATTTEKVD
jgi:hypothetical protein